jgi:hypothetical protein
MLRSTQPGALANVTVTVVTVAEAGGVVVVATAAVVEKDIVQCAYYK